MEWKAFVLAVAVEEEGTANVRGCLCQAWEAWAESLVLGWRSCNRLEGLGGHLGQWFLTGGDFKNVWERFWLA